MDSIINVLPENLIQKIAAGEVIERPASVVKELVENAIDAEANKIKIEIKAGGKQLINVVDNGLGMLREDAEKCVLRHATSKLNAPSDLFSINTLGFRGEALSSIGAISRMTIQTRPKGIEHATQILVEGGITRNVTACARDIGTTIQVRGLFFNTPARRKFLRHEDTETRHIVRLLTHLCVASPHVGFQFTNRDNSVFHYLPTDFIQRAGEVLGVPKEQINFYENSEGHLHVRLCLGKPETCIKSKQKQFMMVRGRPVYAPALNEAIYRGIGALLPQGRHPLFVLSLDVDPKLVDVNVHPAKREVRFADEKKIVNLIFKTVRQSMDLPETAGFLYQTETTDLKAVEIVHDKPLRVQVGGIQDIPLFETKSIPAMDVPAIEDEQLHLNMKDNQGLSPGKHSDLSGQDYQKENPLEALTTDSGTPDLKCWQVHKKYIIAEIKDGLAMIHQQRAHERILYEELLKGMKGQRLLGQRLLFPATVKLTTEEKLLVEETANLWQKMGFEIRDFGQDTIIVDTVPTMLAGQGEGDIVTQVLNVIENEHEKTSNIEESMAAAIAQKTSIKDGQILKQIEMVNLVNELLETTDPFNCPQGKLVLIKLQLDEIDQMFKGFK